MSGRNLISISIWMVVLGALLLGCAEDIYIGKDPSNTPPEVWLSSGPVEGDTTAYRVHFYWGGWDPDGEIKYFEFVIAEGNPTGFNPDDTTGTGKWTRTSGYDSVFNVTADGSPRPYTGNKLYTIYDKTHTFFIRAVDHQGKRSTAAFRSFTAWTLAPTVTIDEPRLVGSGTQSYSTVITFGWEGRDPIDDPTNTQEPQDIRYMWRVNLDTEGIYSDTFNTVRELNKNPWRYEHIWSPWISYRAEGDSGRTTVIGDDEILLVGKMHFFAVQARDEAGAISSVFTLNQNIRRFVVSVKTGPLLMITEPFLGSHRFIGTKMNPVKKELPPGVPLNFRWEAYARDYGGKVVSYRYGWDVRDLNNPDDWDVEPRPDHLAAPERKLYSGTHTFYIEVVDDGNRTTLGQMQIEVIPFSMELNLLWVDDFYSVDPQSPLYETPSETNHDSFWVDICRRADDFKSDRDVYQCFNGNNIETPKIKRIGKYKNIIWTYSSSSNAWSRLVVFTPESDVAEAGNIVVNYLALFLAKGGHLWTLGRSEQGGGLAAIFTRPPLYPASFIADVALDPDDKSGVDCMGYRDYCVTMIDKIWGTLRTDIEYRANFKRELRKYDVLDYAYRDDEDPITAEYPNLPGRLDLWDQVTAPGRFFEPNPTYLYPGGLTYVEIYDPEYYMDFMIVQSQPCFHPMYRMKARSSLSVLNDCTVAIWIAKYEDVVPQVEGGVSVAARSVHFGFPLWFINREQVDQIVDVVFEEWGILAE